jgi:integrase/recombinase XerD
MVLSNLIFECRKYSKVNDLPSSQKIIEDFIAPSELKDQNSPHIPFLQNTPEELSVIGECSSRRQFFDALVQNLKAGDLPGKEHVINYLRFLYRRNCRPRTLATAKMAIQMFLGFIKQLGKSRVEEISRQDLEAFIEHEQDRGLKPNSVRARLVRINALLGFLIEGEIIRPEILTRRIRIKLPELLPKAIDPEDIKKLISTIDQVRDRAMFLMLLRTGMRIGELLQTTLKDINMKERKVMIMEAQKTSVGRVVYFSDDAKEALNAWLQQRDSDKVLLFYGLGRNSLSYTAARVRFQKCLYKAGLSHQGYTMHSLRHTFASELLNAGMRLECLQQLLGHTNLEVTRRYARLTDNTREQEYFRAMSRIERGEIDGHYRFHRELPKVCQEKELFSPYR